MFTKLATRQKIQIGLILAMAFVLILGSNRLDQRHFSTIQTTVTSVYNDRVVVQDYIYQLSTIFHNKELELVKNDIPDTSQNEKAGQLLIDFGNTELTIDEQKYLNTLNGQFGKLQDLENKIANPSNNIEADLGIIARKTLDEIQLSLDALAQIQLSESLLLTKLSQKSLGMNIMLSKLEVVIMIIIGIVMLALIFYPVRTSQKSPNKNKSTLQSIK
ncbi:hypothetical protein ACA086_14625 [Muriicola sp. E247]|uniref:hypothetical protein n=1 Tax=unclassified Muriicola TaxID=2647561 RepID=UPI00351032C1